ncbi:MAG: hypothetical protein KDH19_17190, partial [Geminicoccaceae bacterium]|nr:hypothetical protein [Geminicoccaceae bacterium]
MSTDRLVVIVWFSLLLVSCAPTEPPPPPAPLPEVTAPVRASEPEEPPPSLCPALARMVDAIGGGFASLRSSAIEREWSWNAALTPSPFIACEIEGTVFPTAVYRCESQSLRRGQAYRIDEEYERLQDEIDTCLGQTSWYPRDWRKGDTFAFAGADRQIM